MPRGEKLAARHWAALAASLAPELEEPWLLLAALAAPTASLGYLKQALKINPESKRAQAGMLWAIKRVESLQKTRPNAAVRLRSTPMVVTLPAASEPPAPAAISPSHSEEPKKRSKNASLFILMAVVAVMLLMLVFLKPAFGLAIFNNPAAAFAQPAHSATPAPNFPTAAATDQVLASTPTNTPESEAISTLQPIPTASATASAVIETTLTALPTDGGPQSSTVDPNLPTAPAYTGTKRVEVSISEQHMYVYDGDNLVYSFVISTGMNGATRVGNFAVLDKIPNAYGSTWDLWMPNWLGIYYSGRIENGIHALPILHNGVTLWEGYLGSPISYGCVVLSTYDSQLLYDWIELGTPVIITY